MNLLVRTQSVIVTSIYLHSLIYIPLKFSQLSQFLEVFLQKKKLQNQSHSMPDYFECDCKHTDVKPMQ